MSTNVVLSTPARQAGFPIHADQLAFYGTKPSRICSKKNYETFKWDFGIIQGYLFMPTRKYDRKIQPENIND